jgi:hypothetical protein
MTMIRAAFALFALTVCVVIDAREAAAEIYRPWCVVYTGRGGRSCSFTSFEQCMWSRHGRLVRAKSMVLVVR